MQSTAESEDTVLLEAHGRLLCALREYNEMLVWCRTHQYRVAVLFLLCTGFAQLAFLCTGHSGAAALVTAGVFGLVTCLAGVVFVPNTEPAFVWSAPWSAAFVALLCQWAPLATEELGRDLAAHYETNKATRYAKFTHDAKVWELMTHGVTMSRLRATERQ